MRYCYIRRSFWKNVAHFFDFFEKIFFVVIDIFICKDTIVFRITVAVYLFGIGGWDFMEFVITYWPMGQE